MPAIATGRPTRGGGRRRSTTGATVTERIDRFLDAARIPTPFVVIDLDVVRAKYAALRILFPNALIFYAVKANPAADIIGALAKLGASFDLASGGEIDRCCAAGVQAHSLSFGNTVKHETEIARAHGLGIDLFAFDSIGELEKIGRAAPGARVFCRILVESKGAEWPLTRKFGCTPEMAVELLQRAKMLGVRPVGVSFHVGSQQTDPRQWRAAIASAEFIFRSSARGGLDLELLNIGGGLPAHYRSPVPPIEAYAETIERALTEHFALARPQIIVEPGRYIVGDAGVLRAEVLLVARKTRDAIERWIYLDAGRYNGLVESQGERIHYQIRTPHDGQPAGPAILAGPTCDSTDIIYERARYALPFDLAIGDLVDFLSAGAYTASYASVEFNGFAPLQTHCI
ncbi:MAG: type III PLP-dependent enzyme [Xanthobacteraceae bacterium]